MAYDHNFNGFWPAAAGDVSFFFGKGPLDHNLPSRALQVRVECLRLIGSSFHPKP